MNLPTHGYRSKKKKITSKTYPDATKKYSYEYKTLNEHLASIHRCPRAKTGLQLLPRRKHITKFSHEHAIHPTPGLQVHLRPPPAPCLHVRRLGTYQQTYHPLTADPCSGELHTLHGPFADDNLTCTYDALHCLTGEPSPIPAAVPTPAVAVRPASAASTKNNHHPRTFHFDYVNETKRL